MATQFWPRSISPFLDVATVTKGIRVRSARDLAHWVAAPPLCSRLSITYRAEHHDTICIEPGQSKTKIKTGSHGMQLRYTTRRFQAPGINSDLTSIPPHSRTRNKFVSAAFFTSTPTISCQILVSSPALAWATSHWSRLSSATPLNNINTRVVISGVGVTLSGAAGSYSA